MAKRSDREYDSLSEIFSTHLLDSRDHLLRAIEEGLLATQSLVHLFIALVEYRVEEQGRGRKPELYIALSDLIDGLVDRLRAVSEGGGVSIQKATLDKIRLAIEKEIERLENQGEDPDVKLMVDAMKRIHALILRHLDELRRPKPKARARRRPLEKVTVE